MLIDIGLVSIGLITIYFGGDFLVSGSTRLAKYFKISPFVIGATVIGFGTSTPELAVSVLASLQGYGEVSLGNVIGSNIANIGLVLGTTALVAPLTIDKRQLKEEAPPLVLSSLLILVLAWNNQLNRIEGGAMLAFLIIYLWVTFSKKDNNEIQLEEESYFLKNKGPSLQTCLVIAGFVMLILGANWMVGGATNIARTVGISEWFIGVSIVALGTSLPELVFSMIAAKRGHGEMAIGNVFGSNVFNILMVMGAASSIHPLAINEYIHPDLIYTIVLTFILLIMIRRGREIRRRDGLLLILFYGIYIGLNGSSVL